MKKSIETDRLILREVILSDVDGMFELDSNPNVHLFLGNNPVKAITESSAYIENLQQQYIDFGIGRWAVVLKETNEFLGWSGIKFITYEINEHQNFYEIGYRFIEKHWGKGYATEAGLAFVKYAFNIMNIEILYAYTEEGNKNSRKILEKIGFHSINSFMHEDDLHVWFEIKNPNTI